MSQVSTTVRAHDDELSVADAELVSQLRAGDETAIAELVGQWSPAMYRVARSFVGSAASAEDVVQEAWLGMLAGLAQFEGRSSLRTWTFSILVNRARTRGAREARTVAWSALGPGEGQAAGLHRYAGARGEAVQGWSSIDTTSQWDTRPEQAALTSEALRQLDAALSGLPERQRSVVTMRDICGMTSDEVCAALNISPANQRVLLHRARAALRAVLCEYYRD